MCVSSPKNNTPIAEAGQWDIWDDICSVSNGGDRHGIMAAWCFAAELAWLDICELLTFISSFKDIPPDQRAKHTPALPHPKNRENYGPNHLPYTCVRTKMDKLDLEWVAKSPRRSPLPGNIWKPCVFVPR